MRRNRSRDGGKTRKLDEYFGESLPDKRVETKERVSYDRLDTKYDEVAVVDYREKLAEEEENEILREVVDTVEKHLEIMSLLHGVIIELADADPLQLLEEYILKLVELYNTLSEDLASTVSVKRQKDKRQERVRIYKELLRTLQTFGVPVKRNNCTPESNFGIYPVCVDGKRAIVDREKLHYVLERRIVPCPDGVRRFICVSPDLLSDGATVAGVDTSTREIYISLPLSPIRRFGIAFSVAYIRSSDGSKPPVQIYPHPDDVPRDYLKGKNRYLIIDEYEIGQLGQYYEKRVFECAQTIAHCELIMKLVTDREIRTPDVVFLDGRLYPYEYKFSEILAAHGEYVAEAIASYSQLLMVVDWGVLIVGVVKRAANLPILWRLVKYFLYKKTGKHEFLTHEIYDRSAGTLVWDGILSYYLFKLFREIKQQDTQTVVSSFGVIRPFWTLDEDIISFANEYAGAKGLDWREFYNKENSADFWRDVIDAVRKGEIDLTEAKKSGLEWFENVYHNPEDFFEKYYPKALASSVLMFFGIETKYLSGNGDLRKKNIALPRYEVLLPADSDKRRQYMKPTIQWRRHSGEFYEPYSGSELGNSPLYSNVTMIIPHVVAQAHRVAKMALRELVTQKVATQIEKLIAKAFNVVAKKYGLRVGKL